MAARDPLRIDLDYDDGPNLRPRSDRSRAADLLPAAAPPTAARRRRVIGAAFGVIALVTALRLVDRTFEPVAPDDPLPLESGQVHVVQPGDTLWSLAHRLAPGHDPRPIVDALSKDHGGSHLVVGERLVLDAG